MDAFLPFVQRVPGTPVEPDPKQVVPVFKDARLTPIKPHEQKYLILSRFARKGERRQQDYPDAPYTTPEDEQHVDKDGHLDIFV
ncbi:MAG: hypothetical protein KKE30_12935 [Gammaproteobacteria bacterium]|nr:hypothetical protein [Gammaproteobacteria bacterium]MBU1555627.1 hypothetical protein [Gammaproteobacteria bacterium]MBU2069891.1 hypothetical protein [Gammaproteobacteria bacterium]MBU2184827.1 hypothetical protein [Gammaproteobacteria bacterium]